MNIGEYEVDVEIAAELDKYAWRRAKWSQEKLIAASPFRDDTHPSFYVYLEDTATAKAGDWGDSGAFDESRSKGGFVALLAYLRGQDEYEVEQYLLREYSVEYGAKSPDDLTLKPNPKFRLPAKPKPLSESVLAPYSDDYAYLTRRGLSEDVLRESRAGYDSESKSVVLPWFDAHWKLTTVKYRSTRGKTFWFHPDGQDVRELLYGMNLVYDHGASWFVLVEAEIDALYLWSCGVPAVACGNKYFNAERRDLVVKAGVDYVVVGADNDSAGELMQSLVVRYLRGHVNLFEWRLPTDAKDINDVQDVSQVRTIVGRARKVKHSPKLVF